MGELTCKSCGSYDVTDVPDAVIPTFTCQCCGATWSPEAWEKLMNAEIITPGYVYVEHDDEDHTGEWMDGAQVNAMRRSLEDELATLRADIAYVRGHLEGYADAIEKFGVDDPRQQGELSRSLREDSRRLEKLGSLCPTCKGSRRRDIYKEDGSHWSGPCPDCGGTGEKQERSEP